MGQVEHRVFAKWVSRRHTKVLKTTSNAARPQECDSQSHEMWNTKKALAAGGDLSTRFAWPRSLLLDQDSDGRVDFPAWWLRFIRLGEYCCLVCFQHSLLIHHNSYLCSTASCGPQLSMLTQHPLVHAVPWVSSVGLSLEGLCNGGSLYSCSGSLRMISATGGRGECKNACFPNTRAWDLISF